MKTLKIHSLPKTWVDRDIIMLHACFQILQDYIEKEKGDTHCNYKAHKKFVDEVRFLYNWWVERKDQGDILNEDNQGNEDNKMLIRLIKIRLYLWT